MADKKFKAFIVEEYEKNKFKKYIAERDISSLPKGDVLIRVNFSSLNYKDALSASGHKGITRRFPHTPGIDASGIVVESSSPEFDDGDMVLVTGYGLGMNTSGGFAEYIRVPAEWVVALPYDISMREAMIYGTAGFTAGICIYELQKHDIKPGMGKILVTGATGGVGSMAVGMLSTAGYEVIASTGKLEQAELLKQLGAGEVIHRDEVYDTTGAALLSGRWLGSIDTVGGNTLSTVIRSTEPQGVVCCLGLVESDKLETKVYPFLLRGITLAGIDSAEKPMNVRQHIWNKIANEWKIPNPEILVKEIGLENIEEEIEKILQGGQTGRVIIKLNGDN